MQWSINGRTLNFLVFSSVGGQDPSSISLYIHGGGRLRQLGDRGRHAWCHVDLPPLRPASCGGEGGGVLGQAPSCVGSPAASKDGAMLCQCEICWRTCVLMCEPPCSEILFDSRVSVSAKVLPEVSGTFRPKNTPTNTPRQPEEYNASDADPILILGNVHITTERRRTLPRARSGRTLVPSTFGHYLFLRIHVSAGDAVRGAADAELVE